GVTSAGFVLDATRHPLDESIAPEAEWNRLLTRYPDLQEQFAQSRIVAPESGLQRTGRLQHLSSQTAGENWALLPFTAGFIDPLYSTGIAHTMTGIDRLTHILEQHWKQDSLSDELESYDRNLQREIHFLDRIIELSYRAMPRFELFVPTSMLYFAAATTYEQIHLNETNPTSAFLCADNIRLNECLDEISLKLNEALEQKADHHKAAETYFDTVARSISPFNSAGLCNPQVQNMYHYTAVNLPEL
ncbi:MAG: tryptophan 7-halogenase, partial [Planctomycetaceae bacterium]|nr:tryptophan 7-halogenase [Planctomycetaceae bacterium]